MGLYIALVVSGVLDVLLVLPRAFNSEETAPVAFLVAGCLAVLAGIVGYIWNLD